MVYVIDFIGYFIASFVSNLSYAKPGAAWRHDTDQLLTKLSTDFVGEAGAGAGEA